MLEWCSMIESTISSPAPMLAPERICDELIASVALQVETISLPARAALMNAHLLARILVGLGCRVGRNATRARWRIRRCSKLETVEDTAAAPRRRYRDKGGLRRLASLGWGVLADRRYIVRPIAHRRVQRVSCPRRELGAGSSCIRVSRSPALDPFHRLADKSLMSSARLTLRGRAP